MSRTALVTGSSSGIGRATARAFLAAGWNVVATLRDPAGWDGERPGNLLVHPLDVTDHASIDVALDAAATGADVRLLAGWDSVAPYSLAFSALPRIFFVGAIVLGLRLGGTAPWLQRLGLVLLPVSLAGVATTVAGGFFPLLALSTLGYELWVGAVAWHWLRTSR